MFRNSTITDLFLFVFTQLILHYPEAHYIVLDYYNLGKKLAKQRILGMIPITDEQFFQKLQRPFVIKLFSEELRGKIEMCYGTPDS